jgi:hypothetical protein
MYEFHFLAADVTFLIALELGLFLTVWSLFLFPFLVAVSGEGTGDESLEERADLFL